MKKKESKIQLAVRSNQELERSIEDLADLLADQIKEDKKPDLEPFEVYVQKVRRHILDNVHEFQHRFVHGYELLLEEIKREQEIEIKKDKK